jgi:hypothetical protein
MLLLIFWSLYKKEKKRKKLSGENEKIYISEKRILERPENSQRWV